MPRSTTIARAETAYRLLQEGRSNVEIERLLHATPPTVWRLLRIARENRGEVPVVGPTPAERLCVTCLQTKPLVEFARGDKGYYKHRCKPCDLARIRAAQRRKLANSPKATPPALSGEAVQWHPAADAWLLRELRA